MNSSFSFGEPKIWSLFFILKFRELRLEKGLTIKGLLLEAEYFQLDSLIRTIEGDQEAEVDEESSKRAQEADFTRRDVVRLLAGTVSNTRLRFRGVCLNRLDLSELDLSGLILELSRCSDTIFDRCNLRGCDFTRALVCGASFREAELVGGSLHRSNAVGACFDGAVMKVLHRFSFFSWFYVCKLTIQIVLRSLSNVNVPLCSSAWSFSLVSY